MDFEAILKDFTSMMKKQSSNLPQKSFKSEGVESASP